MEPEVTDTQADWTHIRIRPATRAKYDRVRAVKRLKMVEIADLAVDALFKTDPERRRAGSRRRRERQTATA
jgi:hypothetical protein